MNTYIYTLGSEIKLSNLLLLRKSGTIKSLQLLSTSGTLLALEQLVERGERRRRCQRHLGDMPSPSPSHPKPSTLHPKQSPTRKRGGGLSFPAGKGGNKKN